jgi:hypothetical protein
VLILRAPPNAGRAAATVVVDCCLCGDAMLAPPKGVALGNGRAGVSDIGRFPGAVALLNACGLIRRTTCIVDPRNTLLPQCKIVRDKQQTERHQVLSDRAKIIFDIRERTEGRPRHLFG